jgi:hypothetical protein
VYEHARPFANYNDINYIKTLLSVINYVLKRVISIYNLVPTPEAIRNFVYGAVQNFFFLIPSPNHRINLHSRSY